MKLYQILNTAPAKKIPPKTNLVDVVPSMTLNDEDEIDAVQTTMRILERMEKRNELWNKFYAAWRSVDSNYF